MFFYINNERYNTIWSKKVYLHEKNKIFLYLCIKPTNNLTLKYNTY